jgi:hypothetical protein
LPELIEPLRRLKESQALFAPALTVRRLTQKDFVSRSLQPSADIGQWLRTHRFYLVQAPVTLMPAANWSFTRLECWLGFDGVGAEVKVHDLYPEDVWSQLLSLETQLQLGVDANLQFRASLDHTGAIYQKLSTEVRTRIAAEGSGGARLVVGPFNYRVSRPEVLGRGRENSQVFWRLDGSQRVQQEEPYLAVVLRVPQAVERVDAAGELRVYHKFDFLSSDLREWAEKFRDQLRAFFSNGIPLPAQAQWDDITAG